jgi:hypothetical protein
LLTSNTVVLEMKSKISWISNGFKKIHFFRTPTETSVVSLVTRHTVVLRKNVKM